MEKTDSTVQDIYEPGGEFDENLIRLARLRIIERGVMPDGTIVYRMLPPLGQRSPEEIETLRSLGLYELIEASEREEHQFFHALKKSELDNLPLPPARPVGEGVEVSRLLPEERQPQELSSYENAARAYLEHKLPLLEAGDAHPQDVRRAIDLLARAEIATFTENVLARTEAERLATNGVTGATLEKARREWGDSVDLDLGAVDQLLETLAKEHGVVEHLAARFLLVMKRYQVEIGPQNETWARLSQMLAAVTKRSGCVCGFARVGLMLMEPDGEECHLAWIPLAERSPAEIEHLRQRGTLDAAIALERGGPEAAPIVTAVERGDYDHLDLVYVTDEAWSKHEAELTAEGRGTSMPALETTRRSHPRKTAVDRKHHH